MTWTEEKLDSLLSTPSQALIRDMAALDGDIMVLGAGGKMGPTLSTLALNALRAAGNLGRVIAVSRFSDPIAARLLRESGVELISCDLMQKGALDKLPDCENIIYMAGRKFGTEGQEALTWAMNAWLPSRVAERFQQSRIVVFSSGNVYPKLPLASGGADESISPAPVGDYGMSCLGRERMFEYAAQAYGTRVALFRLNYAVDLRYGVLFDIAQKIVNGEPVSLAMPCFNCIWQASANDAALRLLPLCSDKVFRMNVTGPETAGTEKTARKLGMLLGKQPVFCGETPDSALLSDASLMHSAFGYPSVSLDTLIRWQAEWILSGGRCLNKPTHFEERKGTY
ncbi:MAG TPA: NAD(P)-dependent oxidoreductase [Candidatus Limiplasma sp.]|nr:NAD(P)-dependent oxidoreductase [Candidatus Limiplasma sp.]